LSHSYEYGAGLRIYAYDLEPGASVAVTETVLLTTSVVNEATWIAQGAVGPAVEASDMATVTVDTIYNIYLPFAATSAEQTTSQSPTQPWLPVLGIMSLLVSGQVPFRRR
jgi:hypothetical protein